MKRLLAAAFAVLMAIPMLPESELKAQDDNPLNPAPSRRQVLVGPTFGVHRNYHTGGFRTIDDPSCPVFNNGTGIGYLVGISAEFRPAINGTWSVIPRVVFESRPGEFFESLPEAKVLLPQQDPDADPIVVDQEVTTTSTIEYTLLTASVMYKQEFLELEGLRVAAAIGPTASYVLGGTNRQIQDLVEPLEARFLNLEGRPEENNGRRIVFFDGDIPGRADTRFSVMGGLQGEVGLFNNAWVMTPGIYYDYGLTKVTEVDQWDLSSLLFMIDFRRAF